MAQVLDLGADRAVCVGSSELLDAGAGFDSYLWKNGSTAQTLNVVTPGTYWVTTTFGTQIFRDTVTISFYPFSAGEANIWYFGYNAGLDFNTTPPTVLTDGKVATYEGSATICNAAGELLFYTDGMKVWNKNHVVMPNGNGLLGDFSSTQSGVIIPKPESNNLFYIFTVDAEARPYGLRYNIVDMSLNGGLGALTLRNALLETPMTEKITAIRHENNVDYWVVTHRWNSNEFTTYKIDGQGINTTPIVSAVGSVHTNPYDPRYNANARGYMKASANGEKIAVALPYQKIVEIFDFDKSNGLITNTIQLNFLTDEMPYGIEFSPDGSKLYVSIFNYKVFQYNLLAGSEEEINNSKTLISALPAYNQGGALQLAPNGKIYMARDISYWLSTINNPNALGAECSFELGNVFLNGKMSRIGLPNFPQSYFQKPDFWYNNVCEGDTTYFEATNLSENIDSLRWNFGVTGATATGNSPKYFYENSGSYNIRLIVYQSCVTDTIEKTIVVAPRPQPNLGNDTTICPNTSLLIDGGIFEQYIWSVPPSGSMQYLNVNEAGTYWLTVISGSGCTGSDTIEVFTFPEMEITFTATNASCNNTTNGSITTLVTGGLQPYSYLWETGGTTPVLSSIGAGWYALTVTDANTCTKTDSTQIYDAPIITLNLSPITCTNANNAALELVITNGVSPYTILWSNGQSNVTTISNLPPATYSVTVTDANGCTSTQSIEIENPYPLSVSLYPTPVTCNGGDDGFISISMNGGSWPEYEFLWSNDSTTWGISNLEAGIYSLTVTDAFGCQITAQTTVLEPQPLVANAVVNGIPCNTTNTGSVQLTVNGGTIPYFYLWSNGANTQNNNNLSAGLYTVSIYDNNGCLKEETYEITDLSIQAEGIIQNVSCNSTNNGAINLVISGATAPITFLWSNGATTQNISNLSIGNYSVIITDANNCTEEFDFQIEQQSIEISAFVTEPLCNDASNGAITINVSGGNGVYNFLWNNGATSQNLTNISAGIYTITINDTEGCEVFQQIEVTEPAQISALADVHNISCDGNTLGFINLTVSGGTPDYSFLWSNGAISQNISNLQSGTYSLTITDSHSCEASFSYEIIDQTFTVESNTGNESCNNAQNGYIELNIIGGIEPFEFLWNTGETTKNIYNLQASIYSVTITDALGCSQNFEFTIQAIEPQVNAIIQNITCFGANDGKIEISVTGGEEPYNYLWNNGLTTPIIENLPAGQYSLVVTDNAGCIVEVQYIITEPSALEVLFTTNPALCEPLASGNVTTIINGGTEPYNFLWSNGDVTQNLQNVVSGEYTLEIIDANDCELNSSVIVPQSELIIEVIPQNLQCFEDNSGRLQIEVISGTPEYNVLWSNGNTTLVNENLAAGNYSVTVSDAANCNFEGEFNITQPDLLSIVNISETNILCFAQNNGSIEFFANGGTPPYLYSINNQEFQTQNTFLNLTAGNYVLKITDNHACTDSAEIDLLQPNEITYDLNITQPKCYGVDNGSVEIIASGGGGNFQYQLNKENFQNSNIFNNLGEGDYLVNILDQNNCYQQLPSFSMYYPAELSIYRIDYEMVDCETFLLNGIGATVYASGGIQPYTFFLNGNISNSNYFSGLQNGNHLFKVTDNNNCSAEKLQIFEAPDCLPKIEMPNIFTPNNDGINDFYLTYIENIMEFEAIIYNRWGQEIYRWQNGNEGWNGYLNGNEKASEGTYYYLVTAIGLNGEYFKLEGFFELID